MKVARLFLCAGFLLALGLAEQLPAQEKLNVPPPGYTALFNGKDLTGWKGLPLKANANPKKGKGAAYVAMTMPERLKASPEELAEAQKRGDESAHEHWKVEDGVLVFDGKGQNLCTAKDYGDFELYVDWKIKEKGDSGIYLRGTPQIQIWDPFTSPNTKTGEQKGSGGVFNNQKNPKDPLVMADKPIGEWNSFWIKMVGDKVTVKLNDKLVVDNVTMENYWERDKPLYPKGTIELQNHGNTLYFRNIYVKEL
jgi:3-keto-disaccharide hydrolase